jgi:hypothetical protein
LQSRLLYDTLTLTRLPDGQSIQAILQGIEDERAGAPENNNRGQSTAFLAREGAVPINEHGLPELAWVASAVHSYI